MGCLDVHTLNVKNPYIEVNIKLRENILWDDFSWQPSSKVKFYCFQKVAAAEGTEMGKEQAV